MTEFMDRGDSTDRNHGLKVGCGDLIRGLLTGAWLVRLGRPIDADSGPEVYTLYAGGEGKSDTALRDEAPWGVILPYVPNAGEGGPAVVGKITQLLAESAKGVAVDLGNMTNEEKRKKVVGAIDKAKQDFGKMVIVRFQRQCTVHRPVYPFR